MMGESTISIRQTNTDCELDSMVFEDNYFETNDFHRLFPNMTVDEKKELVMKIYKLIFRFSIDKLSNFLKDDSFLIIVLHYIKETKL